MLKRTALAPLLASADILSDLQAQVQALLAQIKVLQAQAGQGSGSSTPSSSAAYCDLPTQSLTLDDSDADTNGDVSRLQKFLAQDYSIYPEGKVTGYFGPATLKAVQRWQAANGLASSGNPDTTGYGYVGPKTRSAMSAGCGSGKTTTTAQTTQQVSMDARAKENDARIKSDLSTIRVQAELFYDDYSSYTNVCSDTIVQKALSDIWSANGGMSTECASNATTYAVSSPLSSDTTKFWCVDSTGASGQSARSLSSNSLCPTPSKPVQTSPTISYVASKAADSGTVYVGEYPTIAGTGLSGTITVYIGGQTVVTASDKDTATTFLVPSLSAGYKDLYVVNAAGQVSNAVKVLVVIPTGTTTSSPTVEFVGTPTLTLQYDASGRETNLVGTATVKITAGNSAMAFNGSIPIAISNGNGYSFTNSTKITGTSSLGTGQDNSPRVYVIPTIPANASATVTVNISTPTRELFAGTYYLKPTDISYYQGSLSGGFQNVPASYYTNANSSNSKTIVGEVSPYISSAGSDLAGNATIKGTRLGVNGSNATVSVNGKSISSGTSGYYTVFGSGSEQSINIRVADFGITTSGYYPVQIINYSTGNSNIVTLSYTGSQSTSAPRVLYPNGGETINVNQPLTVTFSPSSYGQRVYVNLDNNSGSAYDLLSYNNINNLAGIAADKQAVTLNLPTSWINSNGGSYKIEVCSGSGGCDKSDNPFTITAPTTTTVPTISIIGSPSLQLSYDSANRESALKASFVARVTAGNSPVKVGNPAAGAYTNYFYSKMYDAATNNEVRTNSVAASSVASLAGIDIAYNGSSWTVPAGKSADFSITSTAYPRELFAGTYYGSLNFFDGSGMNIAPTNSTNKKTIVGEVSPYISGVTSDSYGNIKVTGARLDSWGNGVLFDGSIGISATKGDANTISFGASTHGLSNGNHTIQITNSQFGNSNVRQFTINSTTSSSPKVGSLSYVQIPSTYVAGQAINFQVSAQALDGTVANPERGFNVQSSMRMLDPIEKYKAVVVKGEYQSFNAVYSPNTKNWVITMTLPSDTTKTYNIDTAAYCSNSSLGCAQGQINKEFEFKLTSPIVSVAAPTITVTSPNGGETYKAGDSVAIRWNASNFGSLNVWLTLADGYGNSVPGGKLNAANIPNNGYYLWTIPGDIVSVGSSGAFKIVASSYDKGPSASDLSDSSFTITSAANSTQTTAPDLTISDLTASQPTGGDISFVSTVKNIGTASLPYGSNYTVCDFIDGTKTNCNGYNNSLPVGSSFDIQWTRTPNWPSSFSAGDHTFTVMADDGQEVTELSESNNSRSLSFTIFQPTTRSITATISASPSSVTSGQSPTVTWSSTNASYCTLTTGSIGDYAAGAAPTSGTIVIDPVTSSRTAKLTCNGQGGSATQSVTINVTASTAAPSITNFTVNGSTAPGAIVNGGTATVDFASTGTNYCRIWLDPGASEKTLDQGYFSSKSGINTGPITAAGTHTILVYCWNPAGAADSKSIQFTVNPASVTYSNNPNQMASVLTALEATLKALQQTLKK
jgi:hypothetical protein